MNITGRALQKEIEWAIKQEDYSHDVSARAVWIRDFIKGK